MSKKPEEMTDAELDAELAAAGGGSEPDYAGMSDEEIDAELAKAEIMALSGTPADDPITLPKAVMNALDYERAIAGGPLVAKILGVYNDEEYKKALEMKGGYPSTSDLLDRAGFLKDSPKIRGGLGMVGDIASSPSTWLTLGASGLAKYAPKMVKTAKALDMGGKALSPISTVVGKGLEKVGTGIWRSGFKPLDLAAESAGKTLMPSEVLINNDVAAPTTRGVQNKMDNLIDDLTKSRDALLKRGTAPGKSFDPNAAFGHAQDQINAMLQSSNPEVLRQAQSMQSHLDEFKGAFLPKPAKTTPGTPPTIANINTGILDINGNPITRTQVTSPGTPPKTTPAQPGKPLNPWGSHREKIMARDSLPKNAYQTETKMAQDYDKQVARGFQEEAERLSYDPAGVKGLNEQLGSLITTSDKELSELIKETNRKVVSQVDAAGAAATLAGQFNPSWLIAKKAVDLGSRQGPKTFIGRGIRNQGRRPLINRLLGRGPWNLKAQGAPNGEEDFEEIPEE